MITLQTFVISAKDQVSCYIAEESAILNMKNGKYYGLNAVGGRVWDIIREPTQVSKIRDLLVQEYDVDVSRCESDLITLLQRLAEEGLIEVQIEQ